jgi:hypothetical protein
MSQINWSRVLAGGLVAGLVVSAYEFILNLTIMKDQWKNAMGALGKHFPEEPNALIIWVIWAFIIGFLLAWLYAAVRPRLGPGVRTGIIVGVFVWSCGCVVPAIAFQNLGLLPTSMLWILTAWSLPEHIIAAIAGAWLYRENHPSHEATL